MRKIATALVLVLACELALLLWQWRQFTDLKAADESQEPALGAPGREEPSRDGSAQPPTAPSAPAFSSWDEQVFIPMETEEEALESAALESWASLKANHPRYRELSVAAQRLELDIKYAPLFRRLGLGPDKVSELRVLVAERANLGDDLNAAISEQKLNPDESLNLARKVIPEARKRHEEAMRNLLGEHGYKQLVEFESNLAKYGLVAEIQQRLAIHGWELSDEQAHRLEDIFVASPPVDRDRPRELKFIVPRAQDGTGRIMNWNYARVDETMVHVDENGRITSGFIPPDETVTAAAAVLTPQQRQVLTDLLDRQRALREITGWLTPQ